jgi:hypothetical protein
MYIFPVTTEEQEGDRVQISDSSLTLKTYGLPMLFWGYLAAIYAVLFVMWLAARPVINKLLSYTDDFSTVFLGHLVAWTLFISPIVLLGFFFYEKFITKKGLNIIIGHRLFFITIWKKKYVLKESTSLSVDHFMDSPNMAKIKNKDSNLALESMKHFENKGYFELNIKTADDKIINIDRHSRKIDLIKLKEILTNY